MNGKHLIFLFLESGRRQSFTISIAMYCDPYTAKIVKRSVAEYAIRMPTTTQSARNRSQETSPTVPAAQFSLYQRVVVAAALAHLVMKWLV